MNRVLNVDNTLLDAPARTSCPGNSRRPTVRSPDAPSTAPLQAAPPIGQKAEHKRGRHTRQQSGRTTVLFRAEGNEHSKQANDATANSRAAAAQRAMSPASAWLAVPVPAPAPATGSGGYWVVGGKTDKPPRSRTKRTYSARLCAPSPRPPILRARGAARTGPQPPRYALSSPSSNPGPGTITVCSPHAKGH